MELKLESLKYQEDAIYSLINVFEGTVKNTFDNACFEGIRANMCTLSDEEFLLNIRRVIYNNGLEETSSNPSSDRDLCIEMETGTGKTLVYLKTIFELYIHFGFTKFIVLVPSVAIRQGVLTSFNAFSRQLEVLYGFLPNTFEYDSKKLSKVINFIEDQHPQIMIMTLASFNSEERILNQAQREDLFSNMPFIEAIGKTRPIIIMDEPQEGMDTENSIQRIDKLNPLAKLRYSATHKVIKNLIFQLSPYDSYVKGLVKKIEVLTVVEKNDEATLKIEISDIQAGKAEPKIKLKAWHQAISGKIEFKDSKWLKVGDNLGELTNNPSYINYSIDRIQKSLKTQKWSVFFSNGVEIFEKQSSGNLQAIWDQQLEWLIYRHFSKAQRLAPMGIKCLSLVFIDKVANYMGEDPIIKNLFVEKYKKIYPEFNNGKMATDHLAAEVQGYYFAQKSSGEYADNEGGVSEQKRIYDLILKGREELLDLKNPVQFIFSHSALGVGWDNPNVFNIATLNSAFSEIRKRQEIGRGLRICVDQYGQRIYDDEMVSEDDRINKLTVIPNETYETFVTQYQEEIKSIYGNSASGAGMTHTHKGKKQNEVKFRRNASSTIDVAFRRFWKAMSRKTDYLMSFDEESLISSSIARINEIKIPDYMIEASSHNINTLSNAGAQTDFAGSEIYKIQASFTPLDLVEELSENTGIGYVTAFSIINGIRLEEFVKNPPRFIHEAAAIVRSVELDEMLRGLNYVMIEEYYDFDFSDFTKQVDWSKYVDTPERGVYDRMLVDSDVERQFSLGADKDPEVVCFIKLPPWYKIKTPIGDYEPDFGVVMKRKQLKSGKEEEFYFVIETKGTNDINDKKALKDSEIYKIKCALKHFEALGVEVQYKAPIKEYQTFKTEANQSINELKEKARYGRNQ